MQQFCLIMQKTGYTNTHTHRFIHKYTHVQKDYYTTTQTNTHGFIHIYSNVHYQHFCTSSKQLSW